MEIICTQTPKKTCLNLCLDLSYQ